MMQGSFLLETTTKKSGILKELDIDARELMQG
jgi:hypothetical protein